MKTKVAILSSLIAILLIAACATASSAKISRADAEKTALAKVPKGIVKEAELEKEHGRLLWSFDIATPGSKDITEVHVDANTGEIVATEKESEAHEKAEKKSEKAK
jgi:uncharacterized membrane protein YkoI